MKKGFSLIELLVVVAIIGVLAGAGIVGYQGYLTGVREDSMNNQVAQLSRAFQSAQIAAENGLRGAGTGCNSGDQVSQCLNALAQPLENPFTQAPLSGAFISSANCSTSSPSVIAVGTAVPLASRMDSLQGATLSLLGCNAEGGPTSAAATTVTFD